MRVTFLVALLACAAPEDCLDALSRQWQLAAEAAQVCPSPRGGTPASDVHAATFAVATAEVSARRVLVSFAAHDRRRRPADQAARAELAASISHLAAAVRQVRVVAPECAFSLPATSECPPT